MGLGMYVDINESKICCQDEIAVGAQLLENDRNRKTANVEGMVIGGLNDFSVHCSKACTHLGGEIEH